MKPGDIQYMDENTDFVQPHPAILECVREVVRQNGEIIKMNHDIIKQMSWVGTIEIIGSQDEMPAE